MLRNKLALKVKNMSGPEVSAIKAKLFLIDPQLLLFSYPQAFLMEGFEMKSKRSGKTK